MPTLQELTDLFDVLPELPPPLPRQRRPLTATPALNLPPLPAAPQNIAPLENAASPTVTPQPMAPPRPAALVQVQEQSLLCRLFPWAFSQKPPQSAAPARRPHPFMALKAGKKLVVIAVVDAGSISFFRFGQGDFTEWPMV